jgi:two-component sensor histidine kinase
MHIGKFITFLLFFSSFLYSGEITTVLSSHKKYNILQNSSIFIDDKQKYNFEDIVKNNALFHSSDSDYIQLGYTNASVWLRFKVKNATDKSIDRAIVVLNQMLDEVDLYTEKAAGSYDIERKGVLFQKNYDDYILHPYFIIHLSPGETGQYYLQIKSKSCAVYFSVDLMSKDALYKQEISHQFVLVLFFGAIGTLLLYNLFIFLFLKEKAYLFYSLYLLFTILEHGSYSLMNVYIFPVWFWDIDTFLSITYIASLSIFSLLFTREILHLKKYKKIDFVIKAVIIINIFFIVSASESFYPLDAVVYLGMISMVFMLFTTYYALYKKEESAKFIAFGWTVAVFGWLNQGAYDAGVWSVKYDFPYIFELSIFIEAILFSLALANRLSKTRALERSMKKNELLTKELHHRVKNNMQLIMAMYRLKLAKYENQAMEASLGEVESTIQAMSMTHELLYNQDSLSQIQTNEYILSLIEKFEKSYKFQEIKFKVNIEANLDITKSITVGIIINELLTNAVKYAFTEKGGEISISLKKDGKSFELIVSDDGSGYNQTQQTNGFGLELVQSLVYDELHGKIETDTKNGSKYRIIFV